MQFSITTDYAIRTVMFLATAGEIKNATEISKSMGIPKNYQLRITKPLVDNGILKRIRGVKGGFCLLKDSKDITLHDIVSIMETTIYVNRCLEREVHCKRFADIPCPIRDFYADMQEEMENRLRATTIAQLINES
ncbi:MAG: Rrf2 family transcriptional regulator [Megasphaera sp.]|jgi:Rrf2 family protein|nr:Rrf2 family transcriptional regulator [Megasphaera sp.]MCH4188076.1 Rrf2 family transcriptional regulator [Megasphaera sp.]MCH4218546.1 Rrf2 family transcriptional regulator [Megasphaera sp.]